MPFLPNIQQYIFNVNWSVTCIYILKCCIYLYIHVYASSSVKLQKFKIFIKNHTQFWWQIAKICAQRKKQLFIIAEHRHLCLNLLHVHKQLLMQWLNWSLLHFVYQFISPKWLEVMISYSGTITNCLDYIASHLFMNSALLQMTPLTTEFCTKSLTFLNSQKILHWSHGQSTFSEISHQVNSVRELLDSYFTVSEIMTYWLTKSSPRSRMWSACVVAPHTSYGRR